MADDPKTRKSVLPRLRFAAFALAYFAAAAIAIIGTQGYFGQSPDGLAAVYLIVVGLPWSLSAVVVTLTQAPDIIGQVIIFVAPMITLFLLWRALHRSGNPET